MVDVSEATNTVTFTGKVSGYSRYWKGTYDASTTYTKTWKDWCPLCKHKDCLNPNNPKHADGGEITCKSCDADYDGVTGQDKDRGGSRGALVASDDDGSSTETKTVTHGYDVDNPFQGYIRIEYSHEPGATAERKMINFDFSAEAPDIYASFSGLKAVFINNSKRMNSINVWDIIREIEGDKEHKKKFYLRQVALCYYSGEETLYEDDGSDDSTGKIIVNKIGFRKGDVANPTTLGFSGKTILSNLQTCMETTKYLTKMSYGRERYMDVLEFYSPNEINRENPKQTFSEGLITTANEDTSKYIPIAGLSDITYTPISTLINNSIKIFTEKDDPNKDQIKYSCVQSRLRESIMRYGNMEDVEVLSDNISPTEAYYLAVTNDKFINNMECTYTITVEGVPDIDVGDYGKCLFYNQYLNDVKRVESMQIDFDQESIPRLKTTLGMGAVEKLFNQLGAFTLDEAQQLLNFC